MATAERFGYILADFMVGQLANCLRSDGIFPELDCAIGQFDQVHRGLADLSMARWDKRPDFVVVWTRPENTMPSFRSLLNCDRIDPDNLLTEIDQFAASLKNAARHVSCMFVPTWTLPSYRRGFGLLNLRPGIGWGYTLMQMNLRLIDTLQGTQNIYVLDAARWLATVGKRATDPKLWLMGKLFFNHEVFREASGDIKSSLQSLMGASKKLIILDLDDTLWGGVVGETGWESLRLGGHDPLGEAFIEFQIALKTIMKTGVVLAIVSKNNENTALEAIRKHPEMVLRERDFVAWRINWKDKATNIVDLLVELNLGLNAAVFIDDSPAERARVRQALPEVTVPEWPEDKLLYAKTLLEMRLFDKHQVTIEDHARTKMYSLDQQRNEMRCSFQSVEEWLGSLGLVVKTETLNEGNLGRVAQLFNKTNQMNLTTRRMSDRDLFNWSRKEGHKIFTFRVSDRFGDYGLTGLVGLQLNATVLRMTDFILSCRVMGRGIEQVMLHVAVEYARGLAVHRIEVHYISTSRNGPCLEFFEGSRFAHGDENVSFVWETERRYPLPTHIELEMEMQASGVD